MDLMRETHFHALQYHLVAADYLCAKITTG